MLWTLYDVLDAIQALKHADNYVNFDFFYGTLGTPCFRRRPTRKIKI